MKNERVGKEIKLVAPLYSPAKDRGGLNERKQKREKRGGGGLNVEKKMLDT